MIFDVKGKAFAVLKGNWFKVVFMMFLCFFIGVITGTGRSTLTFNNGDFNFRLLTFSASDSIFVVILGGFIGSICFFAIVDLIHNIKFNIRKRFLLTFLYSFKTKSLLIKGFLINSLNRLLQFGIVILTAIVIVNFLTLFIGELTGIRIIKLLGLILTIIIIIWVYLGLSQCMYLLYEEPKISILNCIKNSCKMMKGNRLSLISLYAIFSFWILLGLIAFVIGVLWSFAYFEVTKFEFYQMLKRKEKQKEWHGAFES
ncbi:DUF975 family protein [Metabacillus schmidteae]|uniref:DUF975 family protein n=1 Tax=Metabacillus schmidteae TaxID=2730405 RepID=UPI0015889943|nr:DUF975 family protein [Metabacillus schmidteae]